MGWSCLELLEQKSADWHAAVVHDYALEWYRCASYGNTLTCPKCSVPPICVGLGAIGHNPGCERAAPPHSLAVRFRWLAPSSETVTGLPGWRGNISHSIGGGGR